MEIYKKTLEDKMENFNPLEFNLIDKEFFNMEKEKMQTFVNMQLKELMQKLKYLEKQTNFVIEINESLRDDST